MGRALLSARVATREDVPALADLWADSVRRADRAEQVADVELIVKSAALSPEQRVVVVEYDGEVAGAVFLRIATVTPLNLEPCVQALDPRVFLRFRRHGVGHLLMESAAAFAEENGIIQVATAVQHNSREANRFMARLGFAPLAAYRSVPTAVLRSRAAPQRASLGVEGSRAKVVAARRSLRRARATRLDEAQGVDGSAS